MTVYPRQCYIQIHVIKGLLCNRMENSVNLIRPLVLFTLLMPMICQKIWANYMASSVVRPNIKILLFRVTRPYLNLLVKPRIFFKFSGKNIILCILKGEMPSKCIKLYFFLKRKNLCAFPT